MEAQPHPKQSALKTSHHKTIQAALSPICSNDTHPQFGRRGIPKLSNLNGITRRSMSTNKGGEGRDSREGRDGEKAEMAEMAENLLTTQYTALCSMLLHLLAN